MSRNNIFISCFSILTIILVILLTFSKSLLILFLILIVLLAFVIYSSKKALNLLQIIIMLMTMHTFIFYHLLPLYLSTNIVNILAMWKDIILLLMFLLIIMKQAINGPKDKKDYIFSNTHKSIILFLVFCSIYLLAGMIFVNSNLINVYLNGFRVYCFPFIVYFVARNLKHSDRDCYSFIKNISYFFVAIAIFGIIQQDIFGMKFLSYFHYYESNGSIATAFFIGGFNSTPRLFSTFDGPNNYGIFAVIPAVFFFSDIFILNHRTFRNYLSLIIVTITIFLSFSRSSIIALIFALCIIIIMQAKKNKKIIRYIIKSISIIFLIICIICLSNNRYILMLKSHIIATISLSDPSTIGHIDSIKESLTFIKDNPLGVGIGMTGPRTEKYFENFISSESSYFIVAFDLGVLGLILFLAILINIIKVLIIKSRENNTYISFVAKICLSVMVGLCINYIFLPTSQDIIHSSLIFSMIGLISNYKKNNAS